MLQSDIRDELITQQAIKDGNLHNHIARSWFLLVWCVFDFLHMCRRLEIYIYIIIWDGYMKLNDVHIHENLVICVKAIGFQVLLTLTHVVMDRNPDTLVHIKLVGRWMFKPPKNGTLGLWGKL